MKKFADKLAALKNRENEEGFTLIELVIVVAIIGILTAIAIPSYGAIQNTARTNSVEAAASDAYTAGLALLAQGDTATEVESAIESDGEITVTADAIGTDDLRVTAVWTDDTSITFTKGAPASELTAGTGVTP